MPIGKDKAQEREDDDTVGNISLGQATYLRRFLILTVPPPLTPLFEYFPQVPSWILVSRLSDISLYDSPKHETVAKRRILI